MPRSIFAVLAGLLIVTTASAGHTVGVFLNTEKSCPGYTLFAPAYWYETYLINNEGLKVNSWKSDRIPGLGGIAHLSADGHLYRTVWLGDHPVLKGGGATGGIQKFDWNGTKVWDFRYTGEKYCAHHDFKIMPSGNVLLIVWEIKSPAEAVQAGANRQRLGGKSLYPDHLVEIKPTGPQSGEVVWEWHAWDHLVQDYDATVDNFGSVYAHPELIDINAGSYLISDFIHLNSVDYNPALDQILVTTPMYDEIWVIDHSTTTAEARGHTGGRYGKGGDLLYRWGNPRNYDYGGASDQRLFGGHDANWVWSGYPGAGHVIIFNNGSSFTRGYSSVDEIVLPVDDGGRYVGGLPWGPSRPVWTWTAPDPYDFFQPFICGAQRLPNGNTLTCNAVIGDFFEVAPNGEIVWRYVNPVSDSGPVHQGDSVTFNSVFKLRRYAPDYPAFRKKDMTPRDPVELYSEDDTTAPPGPPGVAESAPDLPVELAIWPVIAAASVSIDCRLNRSGRVQLTLYDALGREVRSLVDEFKPAGRYRIAWDGFDHAGQRVSSGVYFCKLQAGTVRLQRRLVLVR